MEWPLIIILMATCIGLLVYGMRAPGRIYEFPFLAGAITFAFILPQLPGIAGDRFLPPGAYERALVFTILCLIMCRLGWSQSAPPMTLFRWVLDERRLLIVGAAFSAIGGFFFFRISRLPVEMTVGTFISGLPVIYLFFARLLSYGLAIAILCFARRPSLPALGIILFDLMFYFDRIFITGKRGETAELILMIGLAVWFYRGWAPPRALVLTGLLVGTVAMTSIGSYRDITRESGGTNFGAASKIDIVEGFQDALRDGGPEMRNAVLRIHAAYQSGQYDYGLFHWNTLISDYVPAQIVGSRFKEAFMFPLPGPGRDYDPMKGSTETGMADAFRSFGYLGVIKFLLIAYVLSRIWKAAMSGYAVAQIIYMFSAVPAMLTISHHTQWIVSTWVHFGFFLIPALYWARVPKRRAVVMKTAAMAPG